jgi:hypothetical protein
MKMRVHRVPEHGLPKTLSSMYNHLLSTPHVLGLGLVPMSTVINTKVRCEYSLNCVIQVREWKITK